MGVLGADVKKISFIKIDIEGAERPILNEIIESMDRFAKPLTVSVALRPFRLALDAYFERVTRRRGFQIPDNALTAASSVFRSTTSGSNCSGPQRRIRSCSGCAGSLMASRYSA
ncbi:FkbM family methyltransferase [Bradyrhizobium hipponense]|uniref:FkbM family methyltransferase n=1 Tax=Bradyrhizobium hipponense TaxID=2605638 RepID=A0A5S4Y8J7_9BRAD|nr:FkbM family methyltransferase [Bradyrhizobium hipponense]